MDTFEVNHLIKQVALTDAIQEFAMEKNVGNRWTKKTEADYLMHLRLFQENSPKYLGEITTAIFYKHLQTVAAGRHGRPTPHMTTSAYRVLKVFFNWCAHEDRQLIVKSPIPKSFRLDAPSVKEKPIPTKETLRAFLNYFDDGTFIGMRNRTLMLFFAGTGCRLSEVLAAKDSNRAGVRDQDVDWKTAEVKVFGKGEVWRTVGIRGPILKAMFEYKAEVRKRFPMKKTEAFFITEDGSAFSGIGFQETLDRIGKRYDMHYSPHTWRKFFITCALENGMSDTAVMALSGHKTHVMLQHYSKTYQVRKAIAELEKHSPVAGL
jgi:integrase/recombinase XerD